MKLLSEQIAEKMAETKLDLDSSIVAHDPDSSEQLLATLPSNTESWSEHEHVDLIDTIIQELNTGNNGANRVQNEVVPEGIPVRGRGIQRLSGRIIAAIVCGTVAFCFLIVFLFFASGPDHKRLALRR